MSLSARSEGAQHYQGDWIAGGLYILSAFTGFNRIHYTNPELQKTVTAHYPLMLAECLILAVLTVPLLLSWKSGAWIAIAVQVLGLVVGLAIALMARWLFISDAQVIGVAMVCYCVARLRNQIGPPMIAHRVGQARSSVEAA